MSRPRKTARSVTGAYDLCRRERRLLQPIDGLSAQPMAAGPDHAGCGCGLNPGKIMHNIFQIGSEAPEYGNETEQNGRITHHAFFRFLHLKPDCRQVSLTGSKGPDCCIHKSNKRFGDLRIKIMCPQSADGICCIYCWTIRHNPLPHSCACAPAARPVRAKQAHTPNTKGHPYATRWNTAPEAVVDFHLQIRDGRHHRHPPAAGAHVHAQHHPVRRSVHLSRPKHLPTHTHAHPGGPRKQARAMTTRPRRRGGGRMRGRGADSPMTRQGAFALHARLSEPGGRR